MGLFGTLKAQSDLAGLGVDVQDLKLLFLVELEDLLRVDGFVAPLAVDSSGSINSRSPIPSPGVDMGAAPGTTDPVPWPRMGKG